MKITTVLKLKAIQYLLAVISMKLMYTSLNEDWNINTKYEQRPSVQFYNLERGKHLYEEYNLLNKDGQIKNSSI